MVDIDTSKLNGESALLAALTPIRILMNVLVVAMAMPHVPTLLVVMNVTASRASKEMVSTVKVGAVN